MKKIDVDLTKFDNGKPHWLSPQGQRPDIFEKNRLKHRRLAEAGKKVANIVAKMDSMTKDRGK